MRGLRVLTVGAVLLVGLIAAVPAASAGGGPAGATMIGPVVDSVECGGQSITRTETGWVVGDAPVVGNPTNYHITWLYSNADGKTWTYIDTGVIRTFERDGDVYVFLSGHSVNVGPDETGWIGHWLTNNTTGEVWRAGLGLGSIDQVACRLLASS
jgi:hypothetical protein